MTLPADDSVPTTPATLRLLRRALRSRLVCNQRQCNLAGGDGRPLVLIDYQRERRSCSTSRVRAAATQSMRPSSLHGVSVSVPFTWAITSCCLQQSAAGICRYAVSVWWQDILFCERLFLSIRSDEGSQSDPRALILIQPLTPLPTSLPHPLTHPFSRQCVTRSPLLTLTLNALSSINLSPYSSVLAGDVFFHFLPAACTGYPFWSCIPGCDHSKLHGKFFISFYFDFPPGISSQNRANSLFGFSFLRSDISLFLFLCLGGCTQNGKYPSVVHDFCFLLFDPFYSSHTHIFEEPPVFVNHLLASSSHVLAVVLLWSPVSLCFVGWRICEMLKILLVKFLNPLPLTTSPSLSTNRKQDTATCLWT